VTRPAAPASESGPGSVYRREKWIGAAPSRRSKAAGLIRPSVECRRRRIQVPEDYSFRDLHVAMLDAMGWLGYHLHEFRLCPAQAPQDTYVLLRQTCQEGSTPPAPPPSATTCQPRWRSPQTVLTVPPSMMNSAPWIEAARSEAR
jgi:hypothetical protein